MILSMSMFVIVNDISVVFADELSDLEAEKLRKEIAKLDAEIKEINLRIASVESASPDPLAINQTQLAVDKAQLEVNALIKQQNSPPPDFFSTTYNQTLVTAVLAAFFALLAPTVAWWKSKQIIPFSDREKTFRDIAVKRYDNLYKEKWNLIKNYILKEDSTEPDPEKVHERWEKIKNRKFPDEYIVGTDGITSRFQAFVENQKDILEVIKKIKQP